MKEYLERYGYHEQDYSKKWVLKLPKNTAQATKYSNDSQILAATIIKTTY
jgi:hypothetical protein